MGFTKIHFDYLVFGGLGFVFLLSIMTADFQDPTVFNQLYPSNGIQNWIGLMGAITGGSMLEIFGPSSLLIPFLFVRIFLNSRNDFSILVGIYYSLVFVFLISIFHELALQFSLFEFDNLDFFWQSGYAGKLALDWLNNSMSFSLSLSALLVMLIISVVRIFQLLSPVSLLTSLLNRIYNILIHIVNKISPPKVTENLPPVHVRNLKDN
tara:strand:+ start:406 stop:1032 length:627 start_codon:yes stop_codon:yes gene_type:complete